ncbi:hypothetical protein K492DRAFT_204584 [Lichtheimia hyalospora FSU 10163]|nr:hypothetical protein K492DRAFT_204584 [Lichtheimia hyalospora FSU 10163]
MSSLLSNKRSTSMVRASVFVDPQPMPSGDTASSHPSLNITTSRQPNFANKSALAPIGARRAFGEITNHPRQQSNTCFQPMHEKLSVFHSPATPPQQKDPISRFHTPNFDLFGTEIHPFGLNPLGRANAASFGQRTIITPSQQHISRHICITHLPVDIDACALVKTLETFGVISDIYPEYLVTNHSLTVSYYDLRSATQAVDALQALGEHALSYEYKHVQVDFYSDRKLSFLHGRDDSITEAAIVIVTMLSSGARDNMDVFDYKGFFQHWGDIRAIVPLDSFPDRLIVQIEFFDTRSAERIITQVNEQVYEGIIFQVSHPSSRVGGLVKPWSDGFVNRPDNRINDAMIENGLQQHLTYPFGPSLLHSQQQRNDMIADQSNHDAMQTTDAFSLFANNSHLLRLGIPPTSSVVPPSNDIRKYQALEPMGEEPLMVSSPTEDTMQEVPLIIPERRPSVATRSSSISSLRAITTSPADGSNNLFVPERVIDGSDTRTTFMIRNIPNKYTQQMLKESIDATHHGTYDFLYLRIDFQNKCNVGYAFINFINVKSVISFAQERVGKRWSRFNSEKRCSLSYANIQGKDALVDKFRNSTVMDEPPSYRPMLFYSSGPHVGEQQPFPEPTLSAETRYQRRRRTSGHHRHEKRQ